MASSIEAEESARLQKLFDVVDTDGSGSISFNEMRSQVQKSRESCFSESDVEKLFTVFDFDHSHELSFEEFATLSISFTKLVTPENTRRAFDHYDIDGDGTLSLDELVDVLVNGGSSEEEAKRILKAADTDGNGVIDFAEFCAMMSEDIGGDDSDSVLKDLNLK